ncbi:hypothetical protein [Kineosporia succinea]|uniref:Uncharacterized protein n=1 Tax=Kineosporia succinea TaxID=84632 RepID=A0ABT9P9S8_9ACTN|nr:hypothetical protein [Kineosporia succinea]MDP9829453.1 hypothetical protein [Kineosporia succinea]
MASPRGPVLTEVINVSTVPRDLSTGRVIAPGEKATIILTEHEQALVDSGALAMVPAKEA